MKTNAMRLLDTLRISYEVRTYDVGDDHLEAEEVARRVGMPPEHVFKTLIARSAEREVLLAVVPATASLDLKALARAAGSKSTATVPLREVEPLTGYVRGGVTALACKKRYRTFLDQSAESLATLTVSAGRRGAQIVLTPADYVRATQGTFAPIALIR